MKEKSKDSRVTLKTSLSDNQDKTYKFNIEFYIFEENGLQIAYCPSLDLSTSGNSFNDAVSAFYECFQLYVETGIENGSLIEDLRNHGWKNLNISA